MLVHLIAWKELLCVKLDVKLCSVSQSVCTVYTVGQYHTLRMTGSSVV